MSEPNSYDAFEYGLNMSCNNSNLIYWRRLGKFFVEVTCKCSECNFSCKYSGKMDRIKTFDEVNKK